MRQILEIGRGEKQICRAAHAKSRVFAQRLIALEFASASRFELSREQIAVVIAHRLHLSQGLKNVASHGLDIARAHHQQQIPSAQIVQ